MEKNILPATGDDEFILSSANTPEVAMDPIEANFARLDKALAPAYQKIEDDAKVRRDELNAFAEHIRYIITRYQITEPVDHIFIIEMKSHYELPIETGREDQPGYWEREMAYVERRLEDMRRRQYPKPQLPRGDK